MFLTEVMFGMVLAMASCAAVLLLRAEAELPPMKRGGWTIDITAALSVSLMLVLLSFRSQEFGVDTATYASLFADYCANRPLEDFDLSFTVSTVALNLAMAGSCNVALLPMAWALLVVAGVLLGGRRLSTRMRCAAMLLLSMVGVELTTNALRQGLSIAFLVAALGHWERRRPLGAAFAALAVALHASSALALTALLLAALPWGWFLAAFAASIAAVMSSLDNPGLLSFAQPLLYEITKYMGHEGDEIYVRALTSCALLAVLVAPLLASSSRRERQQLAAQRSYQVATRLSVTALPFMLLPYFGYRYVYALLPLVLWLTVIAVEDASVSRARHFLFGVAMSLTLLFVWSEGSSHMREVAFASW